MIGYLIVSIVPLIGVAAGLGRVLSPRIPFIGAGLVLAAFVVYLAVSGIWAVSCTDCLYYRNTRTEVFQLGAFMFGFLTMTTLLGVWLGARLVTVLGRLRRTVREIRGEPDPTAAGERSV